MFVRVLVSLHGIVEAGRIGRQDLSKNADATLPRKTLWVEVIFSVPTLPSKSLHKENKTLDRSFVA